MGPEVLGKPKAEEQMKTIAGSKDRYFNVSNYAALEEILSSLEKNIIGIEGRLFQNPFKCLLTHL